MRAWLERLRQICSDVGARVAGGSGRAGDPEGVLQKAGDDPDCLSTADALLAGQSEPTNTPVDSAPAAVEPEVSTELERPGGGDDSAGPCRKPAQSAPLSPKSLHCTTCFHPDAEAINAKRRKGQTLRSISREHGIPTTSLVRHFKHSGIRSVGDNAEQVPISENGRNTGTDAPPEGADPLLWELGQLRQVAQGALATAARTRNLSATASLLRAANGLLDLLARIEKTKREELKAKQATATALPSAEVREEINRRLDALRERILAAEAIRKPVPEAPARAVALSDAPEAAVKTDGEGTAKADRGGPGSRGVH